MVSSRGHTLRRQLRLDRKDPKVRMGLKYYSAMRADFLDDTCATKLLVVKDSTQAIDSRLEKVMEGLEAHPMGLSPHGCIVSGALWVHEPEERRSNAQGHAEIVLRHKFDPVGHLGRGSSLD